ncbi:hypothetical protein GOP47_0003735, partial [Adiantum capillus-veneris]
VHRVKRTKHDKVKNHWKGRVLAFKVTDNGWLTKVQRVYMAKDMVLDWEEHPTLHSY